MERFFLYGWLQQFLQWSTHCNENYCRCCSFLKIWRFDLAQFISNSRDILSEISSDNLSPKTVNLDLDKRPTKMALGISLDSNPDMLTLNVVSKNIPKINRGPQSLVMECGVAQRIVERLNQSMKFVERFHF